MGRKDRGEGGDLKDMRASVKTNRVFTDAL